MAGTRDARPRSLRLLDVAEAAGVSIATASRSLSGAPGVSESVAERVREVARSLGYVANVHARSLAAGTRGRSGWWSTRSATPTSPRSPAECSRGARGQGLTVQICHSGRDPERELEQIRDARSPTGSAPSSSPGRASSTPPVQADAKADLQAFRRPRAGGSR